MKKFLIPATLLLSVASAAPKISAQSIIVNPSQPDLGVRVWVDRDPGGNGTPNYNIGDHIRVYTSTTDDAYVYLFNLNPDGSTDQILPNRYASGGNFVKANTTKVFPGANDRFTFDIGGPYGVNKVLALASQTPLNLDQISSFKNGQPFAETKVQGQQNLAQALSIVVSPLPQESWVSDTAFYNVARGYATAQPAPVVAQPYQPAPVVNIDITIRPYGGAQNVRSQGVRGGVRTQFDANTRLNNVYNYYDAELNRQGYALQSRNIRGNRVEGQYVKNRASATLEVKQTGSRFEVNITRAN